MTSQGDSQVMSVSVKMVHQVPGVHLVQKEMKGNKGIKEMLVLQDQEA